MPMKEYYGWDQYREEGLAELKKIKKSKIFSGKDKFQHLIDQYIDLYSKERDYSERITGKDLYPEEVKNGDAKPAFDKASRTIAEFKELLKLYYEKGEGQNSEFEIYFVGERDYRLGVRKREQIKEAVPINLSKLNDFWDKIGDNILNFLGIYFEALFAPHKLAERISQTSKFKLDAILIFLCSTALLIFLAYLYRDIIKWYFSLGLNINLGAANFISFLTKIIFHFLKSYFLILNILFFTFFSIILPWRIMTLFKIQIKLYKFANLQFYYILSWAPLLIWLGFESKRIEATGNNPFSIGLVGAMALLWFSIAYVKVACRLFNLSWKKGILLYMLAIIMPFLLNQFISSNI